MTTQDVTKAFVGREIKGTPSSERTAFLKSRYLSAPLMVDVEYIRLLTVSHRKTDGMETLERRAENHAFALERTTPVIHPKERIVGNKTRFIRGAVPYANYAAGPFLREMRKQEQDGQQKHIEQGAGGGIASAHEVARQEGCRIFSGKFLISHADYEALGAVCEYWEDKSMMEVGDAVRSWQQYWNYVRVAHRQTVPLVFCSVFVRDCIGRGKCMDDGGDSVFLQVDHTRIRGGLLNLKFHPTALHGESGSNNLLALIKTYFERPGFHVQFNVVDSNMLRDAQANPERYRDLVVRVAGFSAYWVEMSKALQDQVIGRTEHDL